MPGGFLFILIPGAKAPGNTIPGLNPPPCKKHPFTLSPFTILYRHIAIDIKKWPFSPALLYLVAMHKWIVILIFSICTVPVFSQPAVTGKLKMMVPVVNSRQVPIPHATVQLLRFKDSSLINSRITDTNGLAMFENIPDGEYLLRVSIVNHITQYSGIVQISAHQNGWQLPPLVLQPANTLLKEVTVAGRKSFIQHTADKTIVNVEASITSAGATVMEVLEKSPGIAIDRDGNISLKGRANVLILIDGKPTYVSGSDLAGLLNGISASNVEQIEIMDNPPAKYDAAGNAGIINIKTKKNRQHGFNGNLVFAYSQGKLPKTNNSLLLNYRTGKWNLFMNYSLNAGSNFMNMYALRTYFEADGKTVNSQLQQPTRFTGKAFSQTLKAGADYFFSPKTTLGVTLNGFGLSRSGRGTAIAEWINENGVTDSVITSNNRSSADWHNGGINFNARHVFSATRELTVDLDLLNYRISSYQYFQNNLHTPGGYEETMQGDLPSRIRILSAKADYTQHVNERLKAEAGWKSSRVTTDNLAEYFYLQNNDWQPDPGKTNHFLYTENIHALYGNAEQQLGRFTVQGGLRYEYTAYDATQLGNAARNDSSFSRRYNSLFPTAYISYKADSLNSFTFSAGRRIDRPAFQKLNPFVFVINKYTNQQGNPFFKPQYTWNLELTHQFKDLLTTSVSYSRTKDYFSQIFLADTTGIIVYTEGNLGRMQNLGLSVSMQAAPLSWWSFTTQADLNHKKIEGFLWQAYTATITQLNLNITNQFRFKKGWMAELSGYYITKSQQDLQEVLDPTGQVSAGVSKQLWKNKVTVKLNVRDIFYTQAMQGLTHFQQTNEFFTLKRDSRMATLSFTWRFGKPAKGLPRRSGGGAGDEIQRVGNG
jgi:iron complex outermembrane recepter protein